MDYYNKNIIEDPSLLGLQRKYFNSPLIDRTGTIDQGLKILTPLALNTTTDSFEKIMDDRAVQLLKLASKNNRNIKVAYSGGIDSTGVMVALLRHKEEYPDVTIINVMSRESYLEYPEFYDKHLSIKTEVRFVDSLEVLAELGKQEDKKHYIVTGEIGDQLFGSALMFKLNNPQILVEPWANTLTCFHYTKLIDLVRKNPFYETDKSYACFLWWLNFTLKYQWVQIRICAKLGRHIVQDLIHFYDSPEFQAWAVSTPMEEKFHDYTRPETYKMPAKKYIFDYAKDLWYYMAKTKMPSLYKTVEDSFAKDLIRITEDFRIYKVREEEYEFV